MNIAPTNNCAQQPHFKAVFQVTIPKKLFPNNFSEIQVNDYFKASLDKAVKNAPRKLSAKILNKLGIVPETLTFMNYPGYEGLRKTIRQNGKTWTETRLYQKYSRFDERIRDEFNVVLPDINPNEYSFIVLTGKEKDLFLSFQPKVNDVTKKRVRINKSYIESHTKIPMEKSDITLFKNIQRAILQADSYMQAIDQSSGGIIEVHINNIKYLQDTLNKMLNI